MMLAHCHILYILFTHIISIACFYSSPSGDSPPALSAGRQGSWSGYLPGLPKRSEAAWSRALFLLFDPSVGWYQNNLHFTEV